MSMLCFAIKEDLLAAMEVKCPECERGGETEYMVKGQVSRQEKVPALTCANCGLRVAIPMVVVALPAKYRRRERADGAD